MSFIQGPVRSPVLNSPLFQRSNEESSVTPIETFYILAQNGDIISAQDGDLFEQQVGP